MESAAAALRRWGRGEHGGRAADRQEHSSQRQDGVDVERGSAFSVRSQMARWSLQNQPARQAALCSPRTSVVECYSRVVPVLCQLCQDQHAVRPVSHLPHRCVPDRARNSSTMRRPMLWPAVSSRSFTEFTSPRSSTSWRTCKRNLIHAAVVLDRGCGDHPPIRT